MFIRNDPRSSVHEAEYNRLTRRFARTALPDQLTFSSDHSQGAYRVCQLTSCYAQPPETSEHSQQQTQSQNCEEEIHHENFSSRSLISVIPVVMSWYKLPQLPKKQEDWGGGDLERCPVFYSISKINTPRSAGAKQRFRLIFTHATAHCIQKCSKNKIMWASVQANERLSVPLSLLSCHDPSRQPQVALTDLTEFP